MPATGHASVDGALVQGRLARIRDKVIERGLSLDEAEQRLASAGEDAR